MDTIRSIDKFCERGNETFVWLTTNFTPKSTQNILDIPLERSEIPEELFVSRKEAYKPLRRVKTIGKHLDPIE